MVPMYSVVGSDGQIYGPVETATLQQWIQEGRIVETTELIDPISGQRIQAGQAPALMGTFPKRPMSAPMSAPAPSPYMGYPRTDMMMYSGPPKSKTVGILLAFFLGGLGIHRFYLGHNNTGVAMLVLSIFSCGVIGWIWAVVDIILIATGSLTEANGRPLSN